MIENGEPCLFVHFGYHKAMTMFFKQVFDHLAHSNDWQYQHHNSNQKTFHQRASSIQGVEIHSVNNVTINLDELPSCIGSHIVRDPRDLLVSGYRYHLWCNEPWANRTPMNPRLVNLLRLSELGLPEAPDKSYRELLKSIDKTTGLLVELNWRAPHFDQMYVWDYDRPNLLEIRYEDLFKNEVAVTRQIFDHYGLSKSMYRETLKLVERISFDRLKAGGQTGKQRHATLGLAGQWNEFLPSEVVAEFENRHGSLLTKLGY